MKKIILVPDSFKGTLSSLELCRVMADAITEHFPDCRVIPVPVADGGEGSVDCFLHALDGVKVYETCKGPYFEEMRACYGIIENGSTAVIEMAACSGLPLVEGRKNPMLTTTYGVGELMISAAEKGCKKIILGLGGSCTNDCGCGAAAAAGIKFYRKDGKEFIPTGGTLKDIARIDASHRNKRLDSIEFTVMCDIDNPMHGKNGAAYIFAPQKGADEAMVQELDRGLVHIAGVIERDLNTDIKTLPGGGAAGAMGAGMSAFFHASLHMGIDVVLNTVKFDALIQDADFIFTGEGKFDSQSLRGKVVSGVSSRAKAKGIPVIVIAGGAADDVKNAYDMGITSVFTINRLPEDFSVSRHKSVQNLKATMDNILRLLKCSEIRAKQQPRVNPQ